jgi:hypothetical protein
MYAMDLTNSADSRVMSRFVNGTPELRHTPNARCCSNPAVMCLKCAKQAFPQHDFDSPRVVPGNLRGHDSRKPFVPMKKEIALNYQLPEPLGLPVIDWRPAAPAQPTEPDMVLNEGEGAHHRDYMVHNSGGGLPYFDWDAYHRDWANNQSGSQPKQPQSVANYRHDYRLPTPLGLPTIDWSRPA